MQSIDFKVVGSAPLLMHSKRGLNPFDPLTRKMKEFTSKRKKTDEDLLAIQRIEWELSLHWSENHGPVIPGDVIEATIYSAAKLTREGPAAKRGIRCLDFEHPLIYDGPRDLEALFECGKFIDIRAVRVSGRGIMRTRAIFDTWSVEFNLSFDTETWNPDAVKRLVQTAGSQIGFCDFRPRYGRFDIANGI